MEAEDENHHFTDKEFNSEENFILSFRRIKKSYKKLWVQTRKKWGLTQSEIDLLLFLKNHPNFDTEVDIARGCSLSRSLVCKSVEELLNSQYLIVQTDKQDRRYLHLKLTEKAKAVLPELEAQKQQFWNLIQGGITAEEKKQFMNTLGKMNDNLEKVMRS